MSQLDLVIAGGTVVTAADSYAADIGIKSGRIAQIGQGLDGAEKIDATGLLVLPGGIDAHVHLDQPTSDGTVMADNFFSGTRSAAAGGNTTILPFALQVKGQSLRACVEDYRRKAEGNCHTDVSFHLIITEPTPKVLGQELPALVRDGYTSFKVFMTYDDLVLNDAQLLDVFEVARRERALVQDLPVDQPHEGEVHLGLAHCCVMEGRARDRQPGMGAFNHHVPHLPVQGLSFRGKKSLATASSPILAYSDRTVFSSTSALFFLPAACEDVRCPFEQRFLPLMGHCRMQAVFCGQLRHGALALHGFQRHTSLEARVMAPAQ